MKDECTPRTTYEKILLEMIKQSENREELIDYLLSESQFLLQQRPAKAFPALQQSFP